MARVIGPLLSQEARGQIGKSLVFTRRRGQNIVRGYVIPANPQTPAQVTVRISLAASGIITRRINGGIWTYASQSQTWIQFLRGGVRPGEVWNSQFNRLAIGPGRIGYITDLAQFEALDAADQLVWNNAAAVAPVSLVDYVRGTFTVEAGFMLFWAQKTIATAGYGPAFVDDTPQTITSG